MLFHHHLLCLFVMTTAGIAQNSLTIRGRVTDLAGLPALGLRLMSAAQSDSVFTDADGAFEIRIDKTVLGLGHSVPDDFMLSEPYPNPGAHDARISLSLSRPALVRAEVYNLIGQKIRGLTDDNLAAGSHLLRWDVRDDRDQPVGRGIYFFRIRIDDRSLQRKMVVLANGFSPVTPVSAPTLYKSSAALDLFISDPHGRYADKVERLSIAEGEVLEDVDIRVDRHARLIYDGPDTQNVDVGDLAAFSLLIDDDEPVRAQNMSVSCTNGRVWQITPIIGADGNTTLQFIAGETGKDVITYIYAKGPYSVRVDIPINASPNVTAVRVADGVTDRALPGIRLYDQNGREIGRTGPDGKATGVTERLGNRSVYVGETDDGWTRVSVPLERLLSNDSIDVYRLGPDFPFTTFCFLTSIYQDRSDNYTRPPRQEGDPEVRGVMRGYDPRALDDNGWLLYRLVFPIDQTLKYEQVQAQIQRAHDAFQRATHGRFGLSLFDLVNNTATTAAENIALYDQFFDANHPEKPADFDGRWYVDYGAFFMGWTSQTTPTGGLPDYPDPIVWTKAGFNYGLAFAGSTFEEIYTASAGILQETSDPRFKGTVFEGLGQDGDVTLDYQGEKVQAKDIIFSPFYYIGQAAPGTHVYAVPQGAEKVMIMYSNYGLPLPLTNQVLMKPMQAQPGNIFPKINLN